MEKRRKLLKLTRKTFSEEHRNKNLLSGKPVADPFIVASAKLNNAIVVTQEKLKENASAIPNLCKHFDIKCFDLEGFLNKENWKF